MRSVSSYKSASGVSGVRLSASWCIVLLSYFRVDIAQFVPFFFRFPILLDPAGSYDAYSSLPQDFFLDIASIFSSRLDT